MIYILGAIGSKLAQELIIIGGMLFAYALGWVAGRFGNR